LATTPVFAWRYQGLSDPPNGAILGENLALDTEATVAGLDARLAAAEALLTARLPYRDRHVCTGAEPSITFSGIPTTLRSLHVEYLARGDTGASHTTTLMRINGSAAAVYGTAFTEQDGATETPFATAGNTAQFIGYTPGTGTGAGYFAVGEVDFPNWDSVLSTAGINYLFRAIANVSLRVLANGGGVFLAAGPYTSLTFLPTAGNFVAGTAFQLIGERA